MHSESRGVVIRDYSDKAVGIREDQEIWIVTEVLKKISEVRILKREAKEIRTAEKLNNLGT